ncbi:hypothetical protein PIB30_082509 [Stylosanthes scabra]|uniref:Uncharacterized protein n=1 Tax=Stylosanthes scabra TaxID=79078 RepID=A0ABU6XUM4_9FABA|nr:hypothetical protein [Stylosanthes scabra]
MQIGIQNELGNYKQEVQGLKDKQQELYNHYNNLYNYMKEKQNFLAKELDEIKRFQVGQRMMASSCTDPIEKQSNPNLTDVPTYRIPEIMQENAEKGRNIFYGFLKSDPEVGSSSAPTPGPNHAPN